MKVWDISLASLAAAWLLALYFIAEPEPIWDWRVAAAFLQAILSAGAIYTAWWLQSHKRILDRSEDVTDNVELVVHLSALFEWDAAYVYDRTLRGKTGKLAATVNAVGLRKTDDLLRKVNRAKLPQDSIVHFLGMLQKSDELTATLEFLADDMAKGTNLSPNALGKLYEHFYAARTRFLHATSSKPPTRRKAPEKLGPGNDPVPANPPPTEQMEGS